jgi:osmotically-inducible protein OsmY
LWLRPQSRSRVCPALSQPHCRLSHKRELHKQLLTTRIRTRTTSETADSQTNAKSDRLTTQKIRKAIMADKDLSTYAHNVKIITVDGAVTLKGPVQSEEEKQKVASEAASVVSADKITNELTVKQ